MSKKFIPIPLFFLVVILLGLALPILHPVVAQTTAPTEQTAVPTEQVAPPTERPVVVVESYYLDKDTIHVGDFLPCLSP